MPFAGDCHCLYDECWPNLLGSKFCRLNIVDSQMKTGKLLSKFMIGVPFTLITMVHLSQRMSAYAKDHVVCFVRDLSMFSWMQQRSSSGNKTDRHGRHQADQCEIIKCYGNCSHAHVRMSMFHFSEP